MVSEGNSDSNESLRREIISFWDSRSDFLSDYVETELCHNQWVSERFNDLFPNAHNLRIADIGTGAGFMAISFAELGHRVTATDLSERMLAHAKEKAENRNLDIEFVLDDAEDTKLPKGEFDLITVRDVLHSLVDPQKALLKLIELLRPGGCLIISDGNYFRHLTDPSYFRREDYFRLRDGKSEYGSMYGFSEEDHIELVRLLGNLEKCHHTGPEWECEFFLKKAMNNIRIRCDDPIDYHQFNELGRIQIPFRYSIICQKPYYGPKGLELSGRFDKSHLFTGNNESSEDLAHCFTALSDSSRVKILEHLLEGQTTVSELADAVGLSVNKTSYHLNILKDVGLVGSRKDGRTVRYSLSDEGAVEYLLRTVSSLFKIR